MLDWKDKVEIAAGMACAMLLTAFAVVAKDWHIAATAALAYGLTVLIYKRCIAEAKGRRKLK